MQACRKDTKGLLREFQDAYAAHGRKTFFLAADTPEEWAVEGEQLLNGGFERLGCVPLGKNIGAGCADVYYITAPTRLMRWGRWTKERDESCDRFKELASRAGAFLPLGSAKI